MSSTLKQYTVNEAIEQIQKCRFECEGGPIDKNAAWMWLLSVLEDGPNFIPGQWVYFEITAEAAGKTLSQWVRFCIIGCHMSSDDKGRTWTYDLSWDPPSAYHYGQCHFSRIGGEKLRLENPSARQSAA